MNHPIMSAAALRSSRPLCFIARRKTSTAALAITEEDENVAEKVSNRPRLEALRKELQRENNESVRVWSTRKPSAKTPLQKPTSKLRPSLDEIREKLQSWPVPDSEVLTDKFQRRHSYLRLSLVEKCNLRCLYCMPPEGVALQPAEHLLQTDELLHLARQFVGYGVDKIRLTGGEPLLRRDLPDIIQGLSKLKVSQVGMTTNGVTLSRHLETLREAGLTHVNISLDTLQPEKFLRLTRRDAFDKVYRSIEAAARAMPTGRVKINVVVMKNCNQDELVNFCNLTTQLPVDVRFIEYMPFSENGWNDEKFVSYKDMLTSVQKLDLTRIRDGPNDTTKWYKLDGSLGGRIGFITSMSQHFCGTCNRLRLTADGQLKTCLFGSHEISLRQALRENWTSEELKKLIYYSVQRKHYALGGHGSAQGIAQTSHENRPMTTIGG